MGSTTVCSQLQGSVSWSLQDCLRSLQPFLKSGAPLNTAIWMWGSLWRHPHPSLPHLFHVRKAPHQITEPQFGVEAMPFCLLDCSKAWSSGALGPWGRRHLNECVLRQPSTDCKDTVSSAVRLIKWAGTLGFCD